MDVLMSGQRCYRCIRLLEKLTRIEGLVKRQVFDEGLWFKAETAPEGYLQQELRRLHNEQARYVLSLLLPELEGLENVRNNSAYDSGKADTQHDRDRFEVIRKRAEAALSALRKEGVIP